jgi:ATP:corrinoid adenosyltransferase
MESNMKIQEILAKVQAELKAPKGQYNSFGKYKYRSCEDIVEAVKPLLAKHKAALILSDEITLIGDRVYVKATATITLGEERIEAVAYAREPQSKKGMDESQITGTASSYARKYALNGLFATDDTKDADTDEYKQQQTISKPRVNKKQVQQYVSGFIAAIASEDALAMKEMGDELKDTPEHDAVWQALDTEQKTAIRNILQNAKEVA